MKGKGYVLFIAWAVTFLPLWETLYELERATNGLSGVVWVSILGEFDQVDFEYK